MRVLYVTSMNAADASSVLADLLWLEPNLEIQTVTGAAAALAVMRTTGGFDALFISPSVPQNEALALISSLRRDRFPLAIVAIITNDQRSFFPHAMTAGADDVLLSQDGRLVAAEDTLKRVKQSRHVPPRAGEPRLNVVYAGQDDLTWSLILEIPFVETSRTSAAADGRVSTVMSGPEGRRSADVVLVDEHPGDVHPLHVVKWLSANAPEIPVIVLAAPTIGDVAGAAIELGADEVVNKVGPYRRRLIASLHRFFVKRRTLKAEPFEDTGASLSAAEERIEALSEAAQAATIALTSLRANHDQLRESQAFERALRDRDREELAQVTRELREEQERRNVLEATLRGTEDRATAEFAALELEHESERRRLQEDVANAADRLHQIAHNTQVLQTRLELQLAEKEAERERLTDNALVGHAVFSGDGRLLRCTATFASVLGYSSAEEAVRSSAGKTFRGTPDHNQIVRHLDRGMNVDRAESTMRRADGRPVRVLTSAVRLPAIPGDESPAQIERLVIDLSDRVVAENELQFARRLEAAGRLAAEMSPQIESALADLEREGDADMSEARERATRLVRQLLAFSRHQAKPAGYLSLNEAISRVEPLLRQITGGATDFQITLGEVEPVTAGEDDIEELLVTLVTVAASCLPFGGRLTLTTSSETDSTFVLRTALTVTAAGYGVLPNATSPSLSRHVARCGGTLRISGDAGRTCTLLINLPC